MQHRTRAKQERAMLSVLSPPWTDTWPDLPEPPQLMRMHQTLK